MHFIFPDRLSYRFTYHSIYIYTTIHTTHIYLFISTISFLFPTKSNPFCVFRFCVLLFLGITHPPTPPPPLYPGNHTIFSPSFEACLICQYQHFSTESRYLGSITVFRHPAADGFPRGDCRYLQWSLTTLNIKDSVWHLCLGPIWPE